MPVDRTIFKAYFNKDQPAQWPCPTCGKGVLVGKKDSFLFSESKLSASMHGHDDWEPEWIDYEYSCQFTCSNPACGENIASIGIGSVDWENDVDDALSVPVQKYFDWFRPKYFIPNLNIFNIPGKTPDSIRSEIINSFKLFFADPSSAANHLRIALEFLLDYIKIKKFAQNKHGERVGLTLHHRIDLIPQKYGELKDFFFAIKWLGNAGSHNNGVKIDDVIDAYDIFELILDDLFDKKRYKIKRIAHQINIKKGPRKEKR